MNDIKVIHEGIHKNKKYTIAQSINEGCKCPSCYTLSTSKHSTYTRCIKDISTDGLETELLVVTQKFKCKNLNCSQKIFTERLNGVRPHQRRTDRANKMIYELAITTSAEKVVPIMNKLGLSISHDSVLRMLKNNPVYNGEAIIPDTVKHIGIDDFSFKKRLSYGTLICDLDTKKIIEVLPERTKECVLAFLEKHPHIELVTRDGAMAYSTAIKDGLPQAIQVSDKFHLVKALIEFISKHIYKAYPKELMIEDVNPIELEKFNALSQPNKAAEEPENTWSLALEIQEKYNQGLSKTYLMKDYKIGFYTLEKYLYAKEPSEAYTKKQLETSKLSPYKDLIVEMKLKGLKLEEMSEHFKTLGMDIPKTTISSFMARRGLAQERITVKKLKAMPKPKYISKKAAIKLLAKNITNLSNEESILLEELLERYPDLKPFHELVIDFKKIFEIGKPSHIDI